MLRENVFEFSKIIVGMRSIVLFVVILLQKKEPVDLPVNLRVDRTFQFFDHHLKECIKLGDPKVHEFLRLLALCHTVMSEENSAGKWIVYLSGKPCFFRL